MLDDKELAKKTAKYKLVTTLLFMLLTIVIVMLIFFINQI